MELLARLRSFLFSLSFCRARARERSQSKSNAMSIAMGLAVERHRPFFFFIHQPCGEWDGLNGLFDEPFVTQAPRTKTN